MEGGEISVVVFVGLVCASQLKKSAETVSCFRILVHGAVPLISRPRNREPGFSLPFPRPVSKFIDDDAELDGNKLPRGRHAAPINRTGRTRINNVVIQGNDAARTLRRPWTALQDRINALPRVRLNAGSKPSGAFTGPRACRMGVPADHRPLMKAMQVSVWEPNGFHSYAEFLWRQAKHATLFGRGVVRFQPLSMLSELSRH